MNRSRELARTNGRVGGEGVPAAAPGAGVRPRGGGRPAEEWSRLIGQHQHRVVLALLAAGFRFDRAQELAHEAWARLMEKDRNGQLAALELPGLAIVQARFLAWDDRRREALQARRQPGTSLDEIDDADSEALLVDRNPTPEQRILTREQAQTALRAVASAPASAQRLFRLLYADPSVPHARAAVELGLSVQRVRQILCELRKRVRAAIEGDLA